MPSEQKGAYGGHLASSVVVHGEDSPARWHLWFRVWLPSDRPRANSLHPLT